MNIIKTEKQIKEVDVVIENYNICDKCNNKIEKQDMFDSFKCEFIHETGESYPEGGSGEKQKMELCKKCVPELIQLLRDNGYRVTDSEWEF